MDAIDRELADEQQPDGELGETEMVAYDRAAKLSEQFESIEARTLDDGIVRGTVTAIESTTRGGSIAVDVDLPAEPDDVRFNFTKPKVWSERYDFVRWLDKYDYGSGDFAGMIERGVEVEVRRDGGDYELVIPESSPLHQRLMGRVGDPSGILDATYGYFAVMTVGWMLGLAMLFDPTEPGDVVEEERYRKMAGVSLYAAAQWAVVLAALALGLIL